MIAGNNPSGVLGGATPSASFDFKPCKVPHLFSQAFQRLPSLSVYL